MNGFTPHMAGAIDIMVVEQPDGTLKSSPFYGGAPALFQHTCMPWTPSHTRACAHHHHHHHPHYARSALWEVHAAAQQG